MSLLDLTSGDLVYLNGERLTFDQHLPGETNAEVEDLQFKTAQGRARVFEPRQFLQLYSTGKVIWHDPLDRPYSGSLEPEPGSKEERVVRRRRFWTELCDDQKVSRSSGALGRLISEHSESQPDDEPPPSPETLKRWLRERGAPGARRSKYMPDRVRRGPRGVRLSPQVQEIFDQCVGAYFAAHGLNAKDVWIRVAGRIEAENARRSADGLPPLKTPGRSTIWRHIMRMRTFDLEARRIGPRQAGKAFRALKGSLHAERLLDVAVMDHQMMDCFVCDDSGAFVIGRPWISLMIDVCSRMLLGFHISFEPPSTMMAMACIRMAVRPKDDFLNAYPGVEGKWEAFGVPRSILVDNAWEFTGSSFEDACSDAGISIEWAPVRTPEYKGAVERFFRTLNDSLVHKLPGAIPMKPHEMAEAGLDPQADAVLTLSQLRNFVVSFAVDVYPNDFHQGLQAPPLRVWRERSKIDGIDLAHNLPDLDRALSVTVPNRTLTRAGVEWNGLTFRSDEVDTLLADLVPVQKSRSTRYGTAKVKIKYHPEDISKIFVWNEMRGKYHELPCVQEDYARDLSLHLHTLFMRVNGSANTEFLRQQDALTKKARLIEAIADAQPRVNLSGRRRAARLRNAADFDQALSKENLIVEVAGASNRVGGDRPEKSSVRTRRGGRRIKFDAPEPPAAREVVSIPDPFSKQDLKLKLERARESLK